MFSLDSLVGVFCFMVLVCPLVVYGCGFRWFDFAGFGVAVGFGCRVVLFMFYFGLFSSFLGCFEFG